MVDEWARQRAHLKRAVDVALSELDHLRQLPSDGGQPYVDNHLEEMMIELHTARIQLSYAKLARERNRHDEQ